jgi:hypothetical protein
MAGPDEQLFEGDLLSAEYRSGAVKGLWGLADPSARSEGAVWPKAYFWLAAAPRANAPDRFYVALDMAGYRSVSPTGAFWDRATKAALDLTKWPKGKPGSRLAMVFRTSGWPHAGKTFYHPYDRVSAQSHPSWPNEQPHLIWESTHTIVHYLEEFQSLLTSGDYLGV